MPISQDYDGANTAAVEQPARLFDTFFINTRQDYSGSSKKASTLDFLFGEI